MHCRETGNRGIRRGILHFRVNFMLFPRQHNDTSVKYDNWSY